MSHGAPGLASHIANSLATLASSRKRLEETRSLVAALEHEVAQLVADLSATGAFYVAHEPIDEAERNRIKAELAQGGINVG